MKFIKKHSINLYLILASIVIAFLFLWPTLVTAAPLTPQGRLERAWRQATDIGVYQHRSEVIQTSHPTPRTGPWKSRNSRAPAAFPRTPAPR